MVISPKLMPGNLCFPLCNFLFVNKQVCNLLLGVQLEIFNFLNAKGVKLADDVDISGKIVALKPVFDFFNT